MFHFFDFIFSVFAGILDVVGDFPYLLPLVEPSVAFLVVLVFFDPFKGVAAVLLVAFFFSDFLVEFRGGDLLSFGSLIFAVLGLPSIFYSFFLLPDPVIDLR